MPEIRMDELLGPEASPRAGFEDELAGRLHRGWRRAAQPRRRWVAAGLAVAGIAAAAVLVVVVTGRDGQKRITVDTSPVTTVPETVTTAAPTSTQEVTTTTQIPTSVVATSDAQQTVLDYLTAVAERRWSDAAVPLWEGGLEPEARADLRPLFAPEYGLRPGEVTHEALAAALERWCDQAACVTRLAGLTEPRDGLVLATFDMGVQRSVVFTAGTFEGQPLVNGLPLRLPAGVDPATIVDCVSSGTPLRTAYADLDGDGWSEQVVVVDISTHVDFTIMVCGTDLEVPLMDVPAEQVAVVSVTESSTLLLIDGRAYAFDGTTLVDQGVDATFIDAFDTGSGASIGCGAWDGTERVALRYTFTYEGGNTPDTATVMHVTVLPLLGAAVEYVPEQFDVALPADIETAVEIANGWCDGLPVRTG